MKQKLGEPINHLLVHSPWLAVWAPPPSWCEWCCWWCPCPWSAAHRPGPASSSETNKHLDFQYINTGKWINKLKQGSPWSKNYKYQLRLLLCTKHVQKYTWSRIEKKRGKKTEYRHIQFQIYGFGKIKKIDSDLMDFLHRHCNGRSFRKSLQEVLHSLLKEMYVFCILPVPWHCTQGTWHSALLCQL